MQRSYSPAILAVIAILATALAFVPEVWAATETVLYSFQGGTDGAYLNGGVIEVNGKLYGTTMYGGAYDQGIVFELRRTKAGWVKKTLHDFTFYGPDGGLPQTGLVADKSGRLYGTALGRLTGGVIFELTPGAGGTWKFSTIYTFFGNEGAQPYGGLAVDDDGNLYGTTIAGGTNSCGYTNCGNVFELSPSSSGWTVTTLHDFDGSDGAYPRSTLYRDSKGNLYGNTDAGGGSQLCGGGCGVVFELSPSGGGWDFSGLYEFNWPPAGFFPNGPLAMGRDGALYGTTGVGGAEGEYGDVYRLTQRCGTWRLDVLHSFRHVSDGIVPAGGVAMDRRGDLYGATFEGGIYDLGTMFKLTHTGRSWKESVVLSFDGSDGNGPRPGLIWGLDGRLIGATETGGSQEYGVVYALRP